MMLFINHLKLLCFGYSIGSDLAAIQLLQEHGPATKTDFFESYGHVSRGRCQQC